ncbi:NAD(P)-binding protein [Hypoxylon sp. NC1633]|nr:NAD(P)-binding protein [Hypoxylon sp. NC1633]
MIPHTVLVFGATGAVGSSAARTAHWCGAKVVLAVRDLQKPIPGLGAAEEQAGGYSRVQADLTDASSVGAAARESGASHAFVYAARGGADGMRASLEALRDAGVRFVVFLSSGSVRGDVAAVPPSQFIAYMHARVEVALRDVFGPDGYVALRPAYFDSNALMWANGVRQGEVRIAYPEYKPDWIAPGDIGKAAGTLLVHGFKATEGLPSRNVVHLMGPKFISRRDAAIIIGRAAGKDVKVTETDEDEEIACLIKNGLPEFVARQLVTRTGMWYRKEIDDIYDEETYREASHNLIRFTGTPTSLEEWAEENKGLFS